MTRSTKKKLSAGVIFFKSLIIFAKIRNDQIGDIGSAKNGESMGLIGNDAPDQCRGGFVPST